MSSQRWAACCLVIAALWWAGMGVSIEAQDPAGELRIQELKVQVLPEFDDPRTLVVVQGRLAADSADFPQAVTFRVPSAAQINQMAVMDLTAGGVVAQEYDRQIDPEAPEWALVSYTLDNAHFFYEYYLGAPQEQASKAIDIILQSLQPIDHLLVEVAEPAGSTGFTLEPAATANRLDSSLGLTYHQIDLGEVAADEPVAIDFRYVRQGVPSGVTVMGNPDETLAAMVAPRAATVGNLWLWLSMPVGAAVVLVGIWSVQRRYKVQRAGARNMGEEAAVYCRGCGAHLRAGAQFCHQCGAKADR